MSVARESEHNWRFKSMVFTVYVFFELAHSRAIRSLFLKMLLTLTRYAHFNKNSLEFMQTRLELDFYVF